MKRIVTSLFVLAFASAASADGAATFKARCAICHGQEGVGGKIHPVAIKGMAEAKVLEMIKKGGGKMRPVTLSDEDATAVAKYVSALK
jgi:mono/diheme cytochrome c family protein